MAGDCAVCGKPLPRRGRGRGAVYCSGACRQRAYRTRRSPSGEEAVTGLVAEIERQVKGLALRPPGTFYEDVSTLSTQVGRLRRIARLAAENVTPDAVTESPGLDEIAFAGLVEPHRGELRVHCYRMTGSYDDADDLVQETLLKAWRHRDDLEDLDSVRSWLYRVATNACLDFLRRAQRRPLQYEPVPGIDSGDGEPPARFPWLQPYPDEADPDVAAVSRETIELVFLAAIQFLPPRQRAVLILRDVLDWPADETAKLLGMTVPAVNSALQRARPTLRERLPGRRADWSLGQAGAEERETLRRYMAAAEHADVSAMAELLSADAVLTMPPNPVWFTGRDAIIRQVGPVFDPGSPRYFGEWRYLPTSANRMPAAAGYVRRPGTAVYRAQLLDVLRVENGHVAEITTFEPHLLPAFGLPLTLPMSDRAGVRRRG
ncbi:sigma-70 family RNA polymerase sigma factor [Amycolatopsis sacchari]|uniref:RNA polymerase sigma factor n=1 Tax=Amycolatopsis sacchari TaxID=115433 RepID=A0A1I3QAC3_9PSEU|nr:sigma-70 family RNA polymerase sigma factor [Amycolatopsis sacchari]SFJ31063.1 RNA polymerase sigma-70 factor, ECF subfamily [Amycolatopsis sacchari]